MIGRFFFLKNIHNIQKILLFGPNSTSTVPDFECPSFFHYQGVHVKTLVFFAYYCLLKCIKCAGLVIVYVVLKMSMLVLLTC